MRHSLRYHARHPHKIERRLVELDLEWDIERALEANAATVSLAGVVFGIFGSRRWFVVPGVVAGFLLQHATEGWCPPLPVLRRLGFRTAREIEMERTALKALRGDFGPLETASAEDKPDLALAAARV
ncbi:hypothetical protein WBG79_01095 [Prosthecomicrobium sp. N25]